MSARRRSPSVPGALTMPSCAKAQTCRSSAGAYSSRSGSTASMPVSPTIGSTSTCVRIAVVPGAHGEVEHAAGARPDVVHGERAAWPRRVSWIASSSVPAVAETRSLSSALSRWMCDSTRPGVSSRPPRSRLSRAGGAIEPDRRRSSPPSIATFTTSSRSGTRTPRSRRSTASVLTRTSDAGTLSPGGLGGRTRAL